MLAPVAASSTSPHSLATASGLLLGTLALSMAAGALIGWLAGGAGIGLLIGAVLGIPLAVFVVYRVYSKVESAPADSGSAERQ
jgi:F0F1-type ATP synthase assembly protein I